MTREIKTTIRQLNYTIKKFGGTRNIFNKRKVNVELTVYDYWAINKAVELLEQQSEEGYININDVIEAFEDFMRGEITKDSIDTFLETLRNKTI